MRGISNSLNLILMVVPCCILMSGCSAELDRLGDRMDSLEDRIEALEELCAQINTNIASLQTLVNAVQNNDYITSIAPIVEGEDTVGYIINFTKSGPVMIYHGRDGKGEGRSRWQRWSGWSRRLYSADRGKNG